MELKDERGNLVCKYVCPMNTLCVHCKQEVHNDDGVFMALGAPYYCVLHKWCAPYFKFNGEWPHTLPAVLYENKHPTQT
jgi:hypothetical protein